jgi:hypothetical protein
MNRSCETCRHDLGGGYNNCRINLEAECAAGEYEAWEPDLLRNAAILGREALNEATIAGREALNEATIAGREALNEAVKAGPILLKQAAMAGHMLLKSANVRGFEGRKDEYTK